MRGILSLWLAACLAFLPAVPAWAISLEVRAPSVPQTPGQALPRLPVLPVLVPQTETVGPSAAAAGLPELSVPAGAPQAPASASAALSAASAVITSAPDLQAAGPEESRSFGARLAGEGGQGPSFGGPPSTPPGPTEDQPAQRPFFTRHPGLMRAILTPIVKLGWRAKVLGRENIPAGPVVIVANHISWIDWLFIIYASRKPMRFMMAKYIYEGWHLKWLFKAAGAMPVKSGDAGNAAAIAEARRALKDGQSVVILPEGAISHTGNMKGFRSGFERIVEGLGVPVVPAHMDGLWGSLFSRKKGTPWRDWFWPLRRRVAFRFGPPIRQAKAQAAREAVEELGARNLSERIAETAKPLPLAFLDAAKRFWRKPAVADSTGQDLSYGKTLAGAVLLSGLLRKRLGESGNVGVLLPPSAGGVLANVALGILGKAPVNLNYTASREALAHAVDQAGLKTVVASRKFLEALKAKGAALPPAPMIMLEDLLPLIPGWKKALTYLALRLLPRALIRFLYFRDSARSLDRDATILFTSGSSALPKGVELTHANIQANVEMVRSAFPLTPGDRILGVLPFFHSFGYTVTLWLPLLTGLSAAYHMHPLETEAIAKLAEKYQPTMLLGTPTFLQRYVQRVPAEAFAKLKLVVAGAEKLRGSIAEDFEKKFGTRPYEGYGATELSPVASVNVPDVGPQKGHQDGSVGETLPGSAARVVAPETFAPLPYGQRGLLLIKGPHVMKGYLGEPGKTAAVLRDGWYVTGDLAVIDREGFITLAGRQSRFSKIAGEMISHAAVEEKLHQAAGTSEQIFVVTAVPDERRGERLVVLHAGYAGSIEALLQKAQALGLPGLWTPAASSFYKVDAIPVLGTGKLDLKAIQELALKLAGS